jgi:hypothetical protein
VPDEVVHSNGGAADFAADFLASTSVPASEICLGQGAAEPGLAHISFAADNYPKQNQQSSTSKQRGQGSCQKNITCKNSSLDNNSNKKNVTTIQTARS